MFNLLKLKSIQTPRLILRPIKQGDEHAISEAIHATLEDLQRWMPWSKDPSFETTEAFVKKAEQAWRDGDAEDYPMVVECKQDHHIISATGFNEETRTEEGIYEIGYWLHKRYQGKGLVREYVNALTRFALSALQAKQVQICTQVDNQRSINVAKNCGFHLKTVIPNHRIDYLTGKPADSCLFICHALKQLPALDVVWETV